MIGVHNQADLPDWKLLLKVYAEDLIVLYGILRHILGHEPNAEIVRHHGDD